MRYLYLASLIVAFMGVSAADYRLKLVLFRNTLRTIRLIGAAVVFFLVWDCLGIGLHIFATNQQWVSGLHIITPNLPLEEFLFLSFLSYITLITWRMVWQRTS